MGNEWLLYFDFKHVKVSKKKKSCQISVASPAMECVSLWVVLKPLKFVNLKIL